MAKSKPKWMPVTKADWLMDIGGAMFIGSFFVVNPIIGGLGAASWGIGRVMKIMEK